MVYFDFEPDERYRSRWTPALDVYENADEIVVRVELPGVERNAIRLTWKNDVLTISGVKERQTGGPKHVQYVCVERQYGRFRRDIAVRAKVDFAGAKAEFADGLLRIRLPKTEKRGGETIIPIG